MRLRTNYRNHIPHEQELFYLHTYVYHFDYVLYSELERIIEANATILKTELLQKLKEYDDSFILPFLHSAIHEREGAEKIYNEMFFKRKLDKDGWSLYERWKKSNFSVNFRSDHSCNDNKHEIYNGPLLWIACVKNNYKVVKWLIENGALVNSVKCIEYTYKKEWELKENKAKNKLILQVIECAMPLHIAIIFSNIEVVKLLIDYGADPNALFDNRLTALDVAKDSVTRAKKDNHELKKYKQIVDFLSPLTTVKDYSRLLPPMIVLKLASACAAIVVICCAALSINRVALGFAAVFIACLALTVTKYCLAKKIDNIYEKQVLGVYEKEKEVLKEQPKLQILVDDISFLSPKDTVKSLVS